MSFRRSRHRVREPPQSSSITTERSWKAPCSAALLWCVAAAATGHIGLVQSFGFDPSFHRPGAGCARSPSHRFLFLPTQHRAYGFGTKTTATAPRNHKAVALGSSSSSSNNENESVEYRSIADVVGGLHGGKYQFGSVDGGISDAFSGHGGSEPTSSDEPVATADLPNWARRMAPQEDRQILLKVPSNADPMDGMVHFAGVELQNQERTWETFHAKLMERSGSGSFREASPLSLSVSPLNGSLAPRGGASNACDASRPYSDTATLRVVQSPEGVEQDNDRELWLVAGTEEEQWTYKLELLAE